jgi:hypothetical protein
MHKSLNQLRSELEALVNALDMPRTFWWGCPQEIMEERTTQYPLVVATPTSMTSDRDTVTVTLSLMVADKVYDDQRNRYDVESDTLRVLRDIHQVMFSKRWKSFAISVDQSMPATHFHKDGGDVVDGWMATLTIRLAANLDLCALPIDPDYDLDENLRPTCEPVTLIVNESLTLVYPSGSTATFSVVDQNGDLVGSWNGTAWEVTAGGGDAAWELQNTLGTYISNGLIGCGDSAIITAPDETIEVVDQNNVIQQTITFPVYENQQIDISTYCDDATAVLKNTVGNTLSTTNIASGTSDDIIAPDAASVLKDSLGNTLSTTNIPSGTSVNVTAPNATYNLDNMSGATLFLGSIAAGDNETIIAPDGNVENSDASYTALVESGGTLVLPDSDVNVNGNLEGTVVSVQPIDIDVTDGTNPVTPDAITISGNTVTIEVPAGGSAPVGATLMKTGQTTSYRTGDDGDLQAGRATNFTTLASNNPFGNTDRFTDELGGQTYTNDIVIDWSTYDGATVLGWNRVGSGSTTATWNNCIDNALAVNIGTFTSGWRLPNVQEMMSICNMATNRYLTYSPINGPGANASFWTSTTNPGSTTQAIRFDNFSLFTVNAKTGSARWLAVRTFTVTGTTLT